MRLVIAAFIYLIGSQAWALGDSGCGLGSMIFTENKKGHQILAATTNGTAGNQTFGITTGTSNCSASGFVLNEKKIQHFAEVNQTDLTREMAQGQGEKLAALASLYGCDDTAAFSQMTQSNYSNIVTSSDITAVDMVSNLNNQVYSDAHLVKTCTL